LGELTRPRVLLVDDEAQVLDALQRLLRKQFEVTVASEGKEAMKLVLSKGSFAVVVSDLRMPGMDGVSLLYCMRQAAPDMVRVLLTGYADIEVAITAVNQGNIFRFLRKPCPPATLLRALEDSAEQHRLIMAERELLEQTIGGSLKVLADILALVNPAGFGRALRTRKIIRELASVQKVANAWQAEIASLFAQIGWFTLPPETSHKLYYGQALSPSEQAMADHQSTVTERLLAEIPRLEPVREILRSKDKPFDRSGEAHEVSRGHAIPWGARALKIVSDFDGLESQGYSAKEALATLRTRVGWYDPDILQALEKLRGAESCDAATLRLPLGTVQPGMVLAEDVKTPSGTLLMARGQEVTQGLVARIKNLALDSQVLDLVRVVASGPPSLPPPLEDRSRPGD
jgi:response regulator RpfG family c-di-GMP phosphodiesterase